jgi:hypothetical protein
MTIDYDRDQLSYALANALRERDEWEAMSGRYKQERDIAEADATNFNARIFELINERDEARAVGYDLAIIASHCLGSHSFASNDTAIKIAAALKRWKKSQ